MAKTLTLRLSPKQAKMLHDVLDGALDAGACEDGLTRDEQDTLFPIAFKWCRFVAAARLAALLPPAQEERADG